MSTKLTMHLSLGKSTSSFYISFQFFAEASQTHYNGKIVRDKIRKKTLDLKTTLAR